MMLRKKNFLAAAFEQTYQRAIIEGDVLYTTYSGFLGLNNKAKPTEAQHDDSGRFVRDVDLIEDRNIYNMIEGSLFFVTRLAKNIAKLGTEFVWDIAVYALRHAGDFMRDRANAIDNDVLGQKTQMNLWTATKFLFFAGSDRALKALSYLPWIVSKIGQSITSPMTSMKQTQAAVFEITQSPTLSYIAGALRGLFSLTAYSALMVFVAPIVLPLMSAQVAGAFASAVNFIGSLPVIGNIGAAFTSAFAAASSLVGLSFSSASLAFAGVIAGTTFTVLPVVAALRAGVRKLSPFTHAYIDQLNHPVAPASDNGSDNDSENGDDNNNNNNNDNKHSPVISPVLPGAISLPGMNNGSIEFKLNEVKQQSTSSSSSSKAPQFGTLTRPATSVSDRISAIEGNNNNNTNSSSSIPASQALPSLNISSTSFNNSASSSSPSASQTQVNEMKELAEDEQTNSSSLTL